MKSAPSTTTQTNKVDLSPEQKQIFELAFPYAKEYASSPNDAYGGQTLADPSAATVGAQQTALGQVGAINNIAGQAASSNQFLMNPALLSPDSNPYLKQQGDAITGTVTHNLLENILPSLRSGATQTGGMYSGGNTKNGIAEGLAVDRSTQDISNSLAGLYSDAYKMGLSTMSGAVAQSPAVQMQQLMGANVQSAVGAQQDQQTQAGLDDAYQRWLIERQMPFMRASDLMGMIGAMPGGTGVSTVSGTPARGSGAMGALGGAAMGASLGSFIPGIGTGMGAGIGGLMGFFGR